MKNVNNGYIQSQKQTKLKNCNLSQDLSSIKEHDEIKNIVSNTILRREQYKFKWKTVFLSFLWFPKLRCAWWRKYKSFSQHLIYKDGLQKIHQELDLELILKSIRKVIFTKTDFCFRLICFHQYCWIQINRFWLNIRSRT